MGEQLQRLSSLDWQFLGIEDKSSTHMHIGTMMVFDAPAPLARDLKDFIATRIGLVPRMRQKLALHPLDAGKPVWVDDPDFDIDNHVRAAALPRPGGRAELESLVGDVFSTRLDRGRPMWELWCVEGLEGDRWALIAKLHHVMVDGLGMMSVFAALLDFGPEPREVEEPDRTTQAEPTARDLVVAQAKRAGRTVRDLAASTASAVTNPRESAPRLFDMAKGMKETAEAAIPLAPRTPLNVETGPRRGYHSRGYSLAEFKQVRRRLGGTVNDVVLAVTADALGRYLRDHGMDTTDLELRAEIPSAVRTEAAGGEQGNVFVVLAVGLPVGEMPAVERHAIMRDRMAAMKASGVGSTVATILSITDLMPPGVLGQTSRLMFSRLLFNLLISNVPGVNFPLYMYGSRLLYIDPLPWVGPEQALSVAVASHEDGLRFGMMVDRDAVTDVARFADHLDAAVADLMAAAEAVPAP